MIVDTDLLVPMTEANQNFSKVVRIVDEHGSVVILKNNKPRYVVVDFNEYDAIHAAKELRGKEFDALSNEVMSEDAQALGELAK